MKLIFRITIYLLRNELIVKKHSENMEEIIIDILASIEGKFTQRINVLHTYDFQS